MVIPAIPFFLLSCSKAPQPNDALQVRKNDPVMSARNIEVLFSDSGKIQAKLTSTLMNRFGGENPYTEFPRGFRVWLYDSAQQVTTTITGNRGIRNDLSHLMEAWGNVVVRNEMKNEQLNTEHLVWDNSRHTIWSDVKVRITRPDQVLYGTKMESNEAFTRYSLEGVTGEMEVKNDSL